MAALEQTASTTQFQVENPVTGEVIGSIRQSTPEEIEASVERARVAQPAWDALGPKGRARVIRRWLDLLWEDQKQAIRIVRQETGKTDSGALIEILGMDIIGAYYAKNGPRMLRSERRLPAFPLVQTGKVHYRPQGVVGFISPWNYPLLLSLMDAIPALIAGNAIIIKPSEFTPFSAIYGVELLHKAGVPADIAQIVTGDGRAGAALLDYVDSICFTGSTAVGRKVAVRAAERLIPCSLELGGKDAMIVLDDADLDVAASFAFIGACENAGQTCVSIERIYVESKIYDAYVERVRAFAQGLKLGPQDGFDVHVGSMTNAREFQRVGEHLRDAVTKGAEVIYGGQARPDLGPLFFEPTVLVNVDHSMKVMCEETFGPLIPIMRVNNEEEAIRLANDTEYGLSGAVFSSDLARGERVARRMHSGDITVNRTNAVIGSPGLPWGGQKQSGMGRRGGREGLMRFVSSQSIVLDRQIGFRPALTLIDKRTLNILKFVRRLRRWLPLV